MQSILKYRATFFENWYNFDTRLFFLMLVVVYGLMLFLKRVFIIADIAAFEILQERGEMWVFDIFYGFQYLSIPFFLAWKFTLTAFLLWVGCFMFGYKVTYDRLWRWVMFADLVFLIPEIIKFIWLLISIDDYKYQDLVAFYPFSILSLLDYETIAAKYHYPLKALNVFEIIYWWVLAIGILLLSNKKWSIAVLITLISYVMIFLVWLGYYTVAYR